MWLSTTSLTSPPLLSRDVFVFDGSFDGARWQDAMMHQSGSLKHPSSKHAVSAYAIHLFNTSQFHFNNVGEFSLNLSAAHVDDGKNSPSTAAGHGVLLWPDRLMLHNLCAKDVAAVLKAALQTAIIDARILEKQLSEDAKVEAMQGMVVVASCTGSPGFSHDRAKQTLAWFATASKAHNTSATLVLAEDLRSHRAGTHVLVLPQEDCFELQLSSQARVAKLVEKYAETESTLKSSVK